MSAAKNKSYRGGRRRRVLIRSENEDFVVAFQPEDFVIYRSPDLDALRKVCRSLGWEILNEFEIINEAYAQSNLI